MTDEHFEKLMRDAAATYRVPPDAPLDDMWQQVERRSFTSRSQTRRWAAFRHPWLGIAAALVIGVGVGRWTMRAPATVAVRSSGGNRVVAARADSSLGEPYQVATSQYLDQAAALLVSLPQEAKGGHADEEFLGRAGELLTTTRLLLDSPASKDQRMRTLLEDLELVLAQVVRLQHDRGRTELDLINQALKQRDVIPRLRTAVADASAN